MVRASCHVGSKNATGFVVDSANVMLQGILSSLELSTVAFISSTSMRVPCAQLAVLHSVTDADFSCTFEKLFKLEYFYSVAKLTT